MITVFTGAPGAGKTAALVDYLSKLPGDRPVFVDGLDGLTLPHTPVDANEWHHQLPDGAILVIDEVQRVWRPRGPGSKVPQSVAELETHRHRGIDVFITTQSPKLLDSNVRALVGRHVHIRDVGVLGRHWYEWPEINESMNWKGCVNRHRFKLPKKAFSLYKSASIHTVPVRGFPRALIFGVVALLAFAVLGYGVFRIFERVRGSEAESLPVPVSTMPVQLVGRPPSVERSGAYDTTQFIPRVSSVPESAPAYDALRVVVVMPRVVGGYCIDGVCKCINQQGLDSGLSSGDCSRWMASPPFYPYRLEQPVQSRTDQSSSQVVTGSTS